MRCVYDIDVYYQRILCMICIQYAHILIVYIYIVVTLHTYSCHYVELHSNVLYIIMLYCLINTILCIQCLWYIICFSISLFYYVLLNYASTIL